MTYQTSGGNFPQPPLPDADRAIIEELQRSHRTAWIIAIVAAVVAALLAIALVMLLPLRTTERHTLIVDRSTGQIEASSMATGSARAGGAVRP